MIANALGMHADLILDQDPSQISTAQAWLGILAYTFQIYFDFSGYSDMAIGIGRILGFKFPENFNNPYIAENISEFWRRWHITLGRWMKDYLYIPLGGNRSASAVRRYANLWIVFLISGLWHGDSWNFIVWGSYHGLFLLLDRLFLIRLLKPIGQIPRIFITFFIVVIGWVFFRIEDIDQAFDFICRLFHFGTSDIPWFIPASYYFYLGVAILFSFITLTSPGKKLEKITFESTAYSLTGYIAAIIVAGMLTVICIASITSMGFNPFIYFRF